MVKKGVEEPASPTILVVESYVNQARCLSSKLQGLETSLDLLSAQDAETALSLLEDRTVSLLIINSRLSGHMDGYDLCRTVRSSSVLQQLPVIMLLNSYLTLERTRGISAGADLLLQSPVLKEELYKMVQLLLD